MKRRRSTKQSSKPSVESLEARRLMAVDLSALTPVNPDVMSGHYLTQRPSISQTIPSRTFNVVDSLTNGSASLANSGVQMRHVEQAAVDQLHVELGSQDELLSDLVTEAAIDSIDALANDIVGESGLIPGLDSLGASSLQSFFRGGLGDIHGHSGGGGRQLLGGLAGFFGGSGAGDAQTPIPLPNQGFAMNGDGASPLQVTFGTPHVEGSPVNINLNELPTPFENETDGSRPLQVTIGKAIPHVEGSPVNINLNELPTPFENETGDNLTKPEPREKEQGKDGGTKSWFGGDEDDEKADEDQAPDSVDDDDTTKPNPEDDYAPVINREWAQQKVEEEMEFRESLTINPSRDALGELGDNVFIPPGLLGETPMREPVPLGWVILVRWELDSSGSRAGSPPDHVMPGYGHTDPAPDAVDGVSDSLQEIIQNGERMELQMAMREQQHSFDHAKDDDDK